MATVTEPTALERSYEHLSAALTELRGVEPPEWAEWARALLLSDIDEIERRMADAQRRLDNYRKVAGDG